MASYEHKIKNIYLGDDSWSPNEDTMLYVPMKEDLLDHSLNTVNITNNWISLDNTILSNMWVWYFKWSSEDRLEFSWIEFWTNDFTISWREKTLWNSNSQWTRFSTMYNSWSNWAGLLVWYQWTNLYAWTWWGSWNIINWQQVFSSTTNTRVHRVLTKEWGNWKIYRNNVLFWSATGSGSVWYSTEVIWNYRPWDKNPFYWYMSDFIIEKKAWSQQEITKYYKKTRTDYGYSGKDYQEVEYIESSWTQWIDTWVTPTSNTKSQIKFMNKAVTWDVIYGMYNNNDNADYRFFNTSSYMYFDLNSSRINWSSCTANNIYELEIWNNYVKNVWASSNILTWNVVSGYTGSSTITLNNYNNSSYSQNRWYYVKIREWETQVRDLVPCYRRSDWEIWMYDKVNNVFYTNSWTWTFTKWPDV